MGGPGVLAAACLLPALQAQLILNVVEIGGDAEATDTVVAQWTGQTFVNGVANEPIPGTAADAPYTVGYFGPNAPAYVDRNHRYADDPGNNLPIPFYLLDGEYIMSGNDNRDNDPYQLDVTVSKDVLVYMLIDNRTNDGNNADPPTIGPGTGFMEWIDDSWQPVKRTGNRAGNPDWPDEVGIDEGADGDIDQWFSIYVKAFPAGTFSLFQANNPGRNMYGVVITEPPTAPVMGPVTGTPISFSSYIVEQGGVTLDLGTLQVQLDGTEVSATAQRDADRINLTYNHFAATGMPFEPGSKHTVRVSVKDTTGSQYSYEKTFTVGTYALVPPEYAVSSATTPGMKVSTYQTAEAPAPNLNSLATTEQWWARGLPVDGPPWDNIYFEFDPSFTDGVQTVNWVADMDLYLGDIDDTPADGPDHFNSVLPEGNPQPNSFVPGIPGNTGSTEYYVVEVTTYLQLQPGVYRMGVNSDDGFKVSVAPGQPSPTGMTLGLFDGGRGASDTEFDFFVSEAGYYPFRLLYWQGTGGASCEWYTVDLETGERYLVNGPGSPIKAFQQANDRAHVSKVLPADGFMGVNTPQPTVRIELEDGATQVDAASISLSIDGTPVTPTVTKSSTTTVVTYTPTEPLSPGFHEVAFSAMDNGSPAVALDFTSQLFSPWLPLDKPPYQASEDGLLVVEAEYYHQTIPRGNHEWTFLTQVPDYSGPGYLQALPDGVGGTTSNYPGFLDQNPELIYRVNFPQAGMYYVWVRGQATGGNDDSVHAGIDGDSPPTVQRIDGMGGYNPRNVWVWVPGIHDTNPDTGDNRATITVPSPGEHTIHFWQREDGFKFDKFILTLDPDFVPVGQGPDPSRFVGEAPPPAVAITAPADWAKLPAGDVTLTATASDTDGTITKVEFFANGEKIGEATSEPWQIVWSNPPAGRYSLQAIATDNSNDTGKSAFIRVQVGNPPPLALFVVDNATAPNAADAAFADRLSAFGFDVWLRSAAESLSEDASFAELVVVSSTVNSGAVGTKFRDVPVPLITWEQALQDDMLMTLNTGNVDRGTVADQTELVIVDAAHPLAAGLPAGNHAIVTTPSTFNWGVPAASAAVIATLADGSGHACLYAYDQGALLIDGATPAPGKRVLLPLGDDAYAAMTPEGLALVDAAITWATGRTPQQGAPKFDPPTLSGTTLTISWSGGGTLQESEDLVTWQDVSPAPAGNTYTVDVTAGPRKFYRLRQ